MIVRMCVAVWVHGEFSQEPTVHGMPRVSDARSNDAVPLAPAGRHLGTGREPPVRTTAGGHPAPPTERVRGADRLRPLLLQPRPQHARMRCRTLGGAAPCTPHRPSGRERSVPRDAAERGARESSVSFTGCLSVQRPHLCAAVRHIRAGVAEQRPGTTRRPSERTCRTWSCARATSR